MCSQQGSPSRATDMVKTTYPPPEALSKAGKLSSSAQHGLIHNLVNPSFPASNVPGSVHEKQWESQPKPQRNQKDLQKGWGKQQQPVTNTVGQWLLRYQVLCSVVSNSFGTPGLQPARLLCPWGFSRQEDWSGLPCSLPGDLPDPGIEPKYPVLQADSLPLSHQGSSCFHISSVQSLSHVRLFATP